ncbi:MAG: glucose 1-dehydrogenase [Chloroflexota bacterium]|nr:MAG: glucose 1-dehydrogenase [Chloroflexota bacterium]
MSLEGKVAVVTGAGQGIGQAIAVALAQEGASVAVVDLDLENAKKVADEAGKFSRSVPKRADVSSPADLTQTVREIVEEFGRIDVLVNNAAALHLVLPTEDVSLEEWRRSIDVNLTDTFLCSQAVGKEMIKNKSGKIVNISSVLGHAAVPKYAAYSASKAGILALTKTLAVEWGKYNINVNSISPGSTDTPRVLQTVTPEALKSREERIPLGRVNQPEDIASAVVFLVSSASGNITGEDIKVDGGMLAIHPGWS